MKRMKTPGRFLVFICLAFCLVFGSSSPAVFAASPAVRPSVLIIDGGTGDRSSFEVNWLGSAATTVTSNPAAALLTTKKVSWWDGTDAPATFLLTPSPGGAVTDAEIVWALDAMASAGAERKTVFVAQGAAGLQARRYIEDLGAIKQSSRADAVGLVLLGTPNNGLSQMKDHPLLKLWPQYVAGAGLTMDDLQPGSAFLTSLSQGAFPQILKTIEIKGAATDIGFGGTDGVCASADYKLTQSSAARSDEVEVRTIASSALDLSGLWQPATQAGGEKLHVLDNQAIERLNAISSYVTSPEVRRATQDFYQAWFKTAAPVTHISTVLTVDTSGSMAEKLASGDTKLAAAKTATTDFLKSVAARSGQSFAVPEDVQVIGFNTAIAPIATGATDQAQTAVAGITAAGNTDIGKAIQASADALKSAPLAAEKRIVLLSDGLSTEGASTGQILAGPVAAAKKAGINIDTIAFGKVEQSDVSFLQQIATQTGGVFYQPQDLYGLRLSFLNARYTALGTLFIDKDAQPAKNDTLDLGKLEKGTQLIELGIIADGASPTYAIEREGKALDAKMVTEAKGADGLLILQLKDPEPGAYQLKLSGPASRAHVFAVKQTELYKPAVTQVTMKDDSLYYLIGTGVLMVLAVVITIFVSRRKKGSSRSGNESDFITSPLGGSGERPEASSGADEEDGD